MGSLRSLMRRDRPEPVAPPRPSDAEVYDCALYPGNPKQVQDLLTRGGNPNAGGLFGSSALQGAASYNRVGVVRVLLDHGANVSHRDGFGGTPLHEAATAGLKRSLAISRFLLDHGADINAADHEGWTPLMQAVSYRQNVELVRFLLEKGADPTLRNGDGNKAGDLIRPRQNSEELTNLLEPVS